tara:strand:- start:1922 stop:2716 length:795 start_codon:yes stop_codon:yes gene_type:complete
MFRKRFYYLIKLQYLGFRYHGWQKQPEKLTVERMLQRTLRFVMERKNFKLLAAGRTDAKVSVNETYIELFVEEDPVKLESFLSLLNDNLPPDIRALEISETNAEFNIIQHPKTKEYIYLFSFGKKEHPFSAPFMLNMLGELDIPLMQEAAKMIEGNHDFINFTYKPKENTITQMTVDHCEIIPNTIYTASFFPKESYILKIKGAGFKRHQVRLIMGALLDLGMGIMSISDFKEALAGDKFIKLTHIAQASGLILNSVELKKIDI